MKKKNINNLIKLKKKLNKSRWKKNENEMKKNIKQHLVQRKLAKIEKDTIKQISQKTRKKKNKNKRKHKRRVIIPKNSPFKVKVNNNESLQKLKKIYFAKIYFL